MLAVLNTLVPVFLIIALGAALRQGGFIPAEMAHWANHLTYWVALPALLFLESTAVRVGQLERFDLLGVLLGGTAAAIGAGYLAARGLSGTVRAGELVQSSFRGNLAFIGLPVVAFRFGAGNEEVMSLAVLLIVGLILFYNVAAVLVLVEGWRRPNRRLMRMVARRLAFNPLVLACLLGIALAATPFELPQAVRHSVEPVGRMALPLALISLGALFEPRQMRGFMLPIVLASLIKVALAPMAGYGLALLVGATGDDLRVVLILLACPTASVTFVAADEVGGGQITAGAIVVSTVLSFFSLGLVIGL